MVTFEAVEANVIKLTMSAHFETVAELKHFIEKSGLVQCPCDSAERELREIKVKN